MIESGIPTVGASVSAIDMDLGPVAAAAAPKSLFSVDGFVKHVFIALLVVLLLPAMLLVSAVGLLVPCLLRVPVCGASPPMRKLFLK